MLRRGGEVRRRAVEQRLPSNRNLYQGGRRSLAGRLASRAASSASSAKARRHRSVFTTGGITTTSGSLSLSLDSRHLAPVGLAFLVDVVVPVGLAVSVVPVSAAAPGEVAMGSADLAGLAAEPGHSEAGPAAAPVSLVQVHFREGEALRLQAGACRNFHRFLAAIPETNLRGESDPSSAG